MNKFEKQGNEIRKHAEQLVLDFMKSNSMCEVSCLGMTQTDIFRKCGFDWGDYEKAQSTRQQFWIVALLKKLEAEDKVEQVRSSGLWRLKQRHNRMYRSIKKLVFDLIHRTSGKIDYKTVTEEVKKHFPKSKWKKTHWSWYRSQITSDCGRYRNSFSSEERRNLQTNQ
jgi:hypothetical protein